MVNPDYRHRYKVEIGVPGWIPTTTRECLSRKKMDELLDGLSPDFTITVYIDRSDGKGWVVVGQHEGPRFDSRDPKPQDFYHGA